MRESTEMVCLQETKVEDLRREVCFQLWGVEMWNGG